MAARESSVTAEAPSVRLLALDAFRGFDIAAMLLVNMTWNESVFPAQWFHVPWNDPQQGATFADLVFPWFLFIAGAAIPLSLQGMHRRGLTSLGIMARVIRRALLLYLWGVVLTVAADAYTTPLQWTDLLKWNILQLIAAAYVVAVAVWMLPQGWRIALIVGVLLGKWALMTLLPWPWLNGLVDSRALARAPLGPGTWAQFDAVKRVVHLEHWPPGIGQQFLGWWGMSQQYLPLAVVALFGAYATEQLAAKRNWKAALRVAVFGVVLVAVGVLLQWGYQPDGTGLWGRFTIPYSKWFFSPAYCLLAAGTGTLLLSFFYAIIDVAGWTTAWPLRVYGTNALTLYIGAELSFKTIFSKWQLPVPGGGSDGITAAILTWGEHLSGSAAVAGWAWVVLWLGGWWLVCYGLYRRGIFLRL